MEYIQGVSGGMVNILWWYYGIYIYTGCFRRIVNILCGGIMKYMQCVSGGIVNVLCGGIMEYIYRVFQEE